MDIKEQDQTRSPEKPALYGNPRLTYQFGQIPGMAVQSNEQVQAPHGGGKLEIRR
ncbi:hypothetical protein KDA_62700 [Dictyobacter alpinus]|uniref:Uncharacterized protein n=1 Tax=Dictyobacter alpinus TaxID=2014873 RepID=A0A402BHG9_9CHLR|nr:hypothetical protein KDA_62700 [Dictyobacter alpinus]